MLSFQLSLLTLAVLLLSLTHISHAEDPCCTTGLIGSWRDQVICCAKSCGICGGDDCDGSLGGEANCCEERILLNYNSCTTNDPPCVVTGCPSLTAFQTDTVSDTPDANLNLPGITGGTAPVTGGFGFAHIGAATAVPGLILIEITACDGWQYGSSSNRLQLQLRGHYSSSKFFYVNECGSLPIHGLTYTFHADAIHMADVGGDLFSIVVVVDDPYGYCIQHIAIHSDLSPLSPYLFGINHLGSGVILSRHCKYNYVSLSINRPLVRCFDTHFELYMHKSRGIYLLNTMLCVNKDSGISVTGMVDNVYTILMGKRWNKNVYDTTDIEYLDHYKVGNVRLVRLGHLLATNTFLSKIHTMTNALFTRDVEGKLIGFKLESIGYDYYGGAHFIPEGKYGDLMVKIDDYKYYFWFCSVVDMGRWLLCFLRTKDRVYIKKSTEIRITGEAGYQLYVNVYAIFEGFDEKYQLSFAIGHKMYNESIDDDKQHEYSSNNHDDEDYRRHLQAEDFAANFADLYSNGFPWSSSSSSYNETTKAPYEEEEEAMPYTTYAEEDKEKYYYYGPDWFEANDLCHELYGTRLSSVHSKAENVIMAGFLGDMASAWIGFVDFDINDWDHYGLNHHATDYISNGYLHPFDWKWVDGSYIEWTDWQIDEPRWKYGYDCTRIDYRGGWAASYCSRKDIFRFVCASPYWYPNQKRKFELNVEDHLDIMGLVSLGNDNSDDAMCLSSISINHEVPIDTSNYIWIGGDSFDDSMRAIFKAPVCKTEVIEMEVFYETADSKSNVMAGVYPDWYCQNQQRRGTYAYECLVDQAYIITRKTVFRVNAWDPLTKWVSFASESHVTLETDQGSSFSSENELEFDKKFAIKYTKKGPNNTYELLDWKSFVVKPENSYEDSYEFPYEVDPIENPEGLRKYFKIQRWEYRASVPQSCTALGYVPAAHRLPYEIFFNTLTSVVDVAADLKLTLCDDFMNSFQDNDDDMIVYLYRVPAQLEHFEATGCQVKWGKPIPLANEIGTDDYTTCAEAQQLAIAIADVYVPTCQSNNATLYDGCQCDQGNLATLSICWCVDSTGNTQPGQVAYVPSSATWQSVCLQTLNCTNTEVTLP